MTVNAKQPGAQLNLLSIGSSLQLVQLIYHAFNHVQFAPAKAGFEQLINFSWPAVMASL